MSRPGLRDTLRDDKVKVLYVDADEELRIAIAGLLENAADVRAASTAGEAFAMLASARFDVAVVDSDLDGGEGSALALLEDLARTCPTTLRVLAVADRPSALDDLTSSGVVQMQMVKPFGLEELWSLLEDARRSPPSRR